MLNVILPNVVMLSGVKNIKLLTITKIFFHIMKCSGVFNVYTIISNMCHLSQSVGAKLYFLCTEEYLPQPHLLIFLAGPVNHFALSTLHNAICHFAECRDTECREKH